MMAVPSSPQPQGQVSRRLVPVPAGALSVSGDRGVVFSCVLGSCVSVCLHDPLARAGGMNHIALPRPASDGPEGSLEPGRFATTAVDLLARRLVALTGRRRGMEAFLFGGGRMYDSACDLGALNVSAVKEALMRLSIPVMREETGLPGYMRLHFEPVTGRIERAG